MPSDGEREEGDALAALQAMSRYLEAVMNRQGGGAHMGGREYFAESRTRPMFLEDGR